MSHPVASIPAQTKYVSIGFRDVLYSNLWISSFQSAKATWFVSCKKVRCPRLQLGGKSLEGHSMLPLLQKSGRQSGEAE